MIMALHGGSWRQFACRAMLTVAAAWIPAVVAGPSSIGAEVQQSLTVAYVAPVGSMAPLWVADAAHTFDRYHVRVDIQFIQANAAIAALLGRDVDAVQISAPPMIAANLGMSEHPLVFVASALNHASLSLYTDASIRSAAQLKGKTLASDRPGTPIDFAMHTALSLLGVSPSDVTLLPLGSAQIQLEALLSGQVQGAILGPPQSFQAAARGFHDLKDTFRVPYQNVGIVVLRSRVQTLGPALVPFLAGYRDGIVTYNRDAALAMRMLQQYTKESDPTILRQTYEFYRDLPFEPSLRPTLEGIQATLDFFSRTMPAAKQITAKDLVDLRFLSQLPTR